ncbi:MAG: Nif3-like dinuclear metal center hexameric protein [bacterium]
MKLKDVCEFLDRELRTKDISDYSLNGLQVEGREDIEKIGFAVDGSQETFIKAKDSSCNLVVVHHGLFWGIQEPITGILYKRIKVLIENGISLYASHLPLDLHPKFGNNISLINLFNPFNVEPFGKYEGQDIGFLGRLKEPLHREDIAKILNEALNTSSKILPCGKEKIETIAVISGGGCDCLKEAAEKKVNLFITGEHKLFSFSIAKEAGLNIIFSGHYATETIGIKALMEEIKKKFALPCIFIDIPCWL